MKYRGFFRKKDQLFDNILFRMRSQKMEMFCCVCEYVSLMMMTSCYCLRCRLGIQSMPVLLNDTEEEVNDYLGRAIDARSIDRLRAEHCKVSWRRNPLKNFATRAGLRIEHFGKKHNTQGKNSIIQEKNSGFPQFCKIVNRNSNTKVESLRVPLRKF